MSKVIHVNDNNFQTEVLESDLPVLVDFWAEWCGPCKMIAPVVEQLAAEFEGKVKVAKCDTESSYKTPAKYGIRGIPTLLLFKNGQAMDQIVGAVPKTVLTNFLNKAVAAN